MKLIIGESESKLGFVWNISCPRNACFVLSVIKNPKLQVLKDIIEETDNKIIIWANYIYNIKEIINFIILVVS